MQKRVNLFPVFLIFLVLSVLVFFISQKQIALEGGLASLLLPIQRTAYSLVKVGDKTEMQKLVDENIELQKKIIDQQILEKDNQALRDQFATVTIPTKTLLPAKIVGARSFVPGVSQSHAIIIDQGSENGVKSGMVVVYKDNVIGKVGTVTKRLSVVTMLTNSSTSFTAKTLKTGALGVVKGQKSDGLILDNVLLSDKLEVSDTVLTKGDKDTNGAGFPPDLVVGKIVSVNKKASALFQSAEVKSLVDVTGLSMVFVMKE